MISLYYLYVPVDIADIRYNWLLWIVVVTILFIKLPFCYVIAHQNICRNPFFSDEKFLCHRRRQLDTLFSLYVSDAIVSFILNQIDRSDNNNNNSTIPSSIDERIVKSDRPLCFANNYHTTLNTLFLLLSPFFSLWFLLSPFFSLWSI